MKPFSWRFTAPLYLGGALNPINTTLIATALVPIAHAMRVSVGRTSVLVACLYLASSIAQPTMGKLAEEFGPRRVFMVGASLVLCAGIVGGLAQSLTALIVARVLIGIGTSAGYPSGMLLVRRRASESGLEAPPGSVLGGFSITSQSIAVIGLPIGGVLVDWLGWRATFLINLPTGLLTLVLLAIWIPRDAPIERRPLREIAGRIDLVGIVGFGAAMSSLLVFLLALPGFDPVPLALFAVLAAAEVWWELRAPNAFFDVRMLGANLALTRTYLRTAVTMLCAYTVIYGISQWLEASRGLSARQTGLLIVPMSVVAIAVTTPVSRRNLVRGPLIASAVAAIAGSAVALVLHSQTPVIAIIAMTLVFGVVNGAGSTANQLSLYSQSPAERVGTAAGLFRTFGYLGSIASSTLTGIVFHTHVTDHGLHTIALILIVLSALLLVMTLTDRRLEIERDHRPEAHRPARHGLPAGHRGTAARS